MCIRYLTEYFISTHVWKIKRVIVESIFGFLKSIGNVGSASRCAIVCVKFYLILGLAYVYLSDADVHEALTGVYRGVKPVAKVCEGLQVC